MLLKHFTIIYDVACFQLSHIPDFEGDDLRKLANEINKAKQFLKQAITFNKMYDRREKFNEGKQASTLLQIQNGNFLYSI